MGRAWQVAWPAVVIIALWLIAVVVPGVAGEFPLNDDWIYSTPALTWVATGQPVFPMRASPMLAQVAWGAAFARMLGPTYATLRLSTFALGLVALWSAYALLRRVGASRSASCLAALVLAANPVFVALSHTFMTDVPFTAAATLAFVALARAAERRDPASIVVGAALAAVATLVRMEGLLLGIVCLGWRVRGATRADWPRRLAPLALSLAALGSARLLVSGTSTHGRDAVAATGYQYPLDRMLLGLPSSLMHAAGALPWHVFCALAYLGLFLAPVVVLAVLSTRGQAKPRGPILAAVIVACAASFAFGWRMPLAGNILFDVGVGPLTLRDTYVLGLAHWPRAWPALWWLATFGAVASGCLLLRLVVVGWRRLGDPARTANIALLLAACYVLMPVVVEFRDRHLLVALPLLMAAVLARRRPSSDSASAGFDVPASPGVDAARNPFRHVLPLALVAAMLAFAVAATHDYLAWNDARWRALAALERAGISPARIDGGFEYNALRGYDPAHTPGTGKSWWWVNDDEFVVAFGPLPGYRIVRADPFTAWMPPRTTAILTLRREGAGRTDAGPVRGWFFCQ